MVDQNSDSLSSHVLYYASSLRGAHQCWMQERRRLIAMVDDLQFSLPTAVTDTGGLQWFQLKPLLKNAHRIQLMGGDIFNLTVQAKGFRRLR